MALLGVKYAVASTPQAALNDYLDLTSTTESLYGAATTTPPPTASDILWRNWSTGGVELWNSERLGGLHLREFGHSQHELADRWNR